MKLNLSLGNRAAIYLRSSSLKQKEKELSVPAQRDECLKFLQAHDLVLYDEFVDDGITGTSTHKRKAFKDLMNLALSDERPFEFIIVWKMNRFARNYEDSFLHKSLLRKKGIRVVSVTEQTGGDTFGEQLYEDIVDRFAEKFSRDLGEDTRRGMHKAAEMGWWPFGKAPYGYDIVKVDSGKSKKSKLTVNKHRAAVVRKMAYLSVRHNMGVKRIAAFLNERGIYDDRGRLVDSRFLFTGFLKCGYCGAPLFGSSGTSKTKRVYDYYSCKTRRDTGNCECDHFSKDFLEDALVDHFNRSLLTEKNMVYFVKWYRKKEKEIHNAMQAEIFTLNKELKDVNRRMDNIYSAIELADGDPRMLTERLESLEFRKKQLQVEIKKVPVNQFPDFSKQKVLAAARDMRNTLREADHARSKNFLNRFVQQITVFSDRAEIRYSLPINGSYERVLSWLSNAPRRGIEPLLQE